MLKAFFALILLVCASGAHLLAQDAIANAAAKSKSNLKVEKLLITSKPIAVYTESAKANNVEGIVRLKIKFKKDGTIGKKIKVVEGLPGGLNEQAIAAARKIRFVSEKRNGKAVTVAKTVGYNFRIY